jgi:hypothetical protein
VSDTTSKTETFVFSRDELEALLGDKRVSQMLERRNLRSLEKTSKPFENDFDIAIRLMTGHSRPQLWSGRLAKCAVRYFLTHEDLRIGFVQWMKSQREQFTTDRVREVAGSVSQPAKV